MCLLSSSIILSLSSSSVMAKEYYKWVDAKGSTHYTATPPPKNAKKKGRVETYGSKTATVAKAQTPSPATSATAPATEQTQPNSVAPKETPTPIESTSR
ncbi:DUF4124 domain-containing protein [Acinetobacter portensis]|uniref:DUF4124 domain-containing protein n=1 Tax=Acinetobacter portensis TaxID=1839785 RepID=UPI0036179EC8